MRERAPFVAGLAAALAAALVSVGLLTRKPLPVAFDDEDAARRLPPAAHEDRDVGFGPLALGGAGVLLALAAAMGLAAWLYPGSVSDRVLALPLPEFPAPRLQTDTAADMAALRAAQLQALGTLGWADRAQGLVRIPIAQAMQDVARDGIADWPGTARVQR